MKVIMIFSLLIFAQRTFAQKADLLLIDEDIEASSLEQNYRIHKGSTLKSFLPPKEQRDAFLVFVPESKEWDEYQKDVFYMDFLKKPISEIQKKHPQYTKEKIKELKSKL